MEVQRAARQCSNLRARGRLFCEPILWPVVEGGGRRCASRMEEGGSASGATDRCATYDRSGHRADRINDLRPTHQIECGDAKASRGLPGRRAPCTSKCGSARRPPRRSKRRHLWRREEGRGCDPQRGFCRVPRGSASALDDRMIRRCDNAEYVEHARKRLTRMRTQSIAQPRAHVHAPMQLDRYRIITWGTAGGASIWM